MTLLSCVPLLFAKGVWATLDVIATAWRTTDEAPDLGDTASCVCKSWVVGSLIWSLPNCRVVLTTGRAWSRRVLMQRCLDTKLNRRRHLRWHLVTSADRSLGRRTLSHNLIDNHEYADAYSILTIPTRLSIRRFSHGADHWLKLTWTKMHCWQSLALRCSLCV